LEYCEFLYHHGIITGGRFDFCIPGV
jgi:hypothetical protein